MRDLNMFRNAINFLKDRRGNIAPIFALSLVPTIGMIGAAVDYSRASNIRTSIQSALDSTTLAMATNAATLSEDQLKASAKAYFNSVFKTPGTTGVELTTTFSNTNGSQ